MLFRSRPRPTHFLETVDRGTCQDTETIRPTEAHSHPGDGRQSDLSGHQSNPTDQAHSHPGDGSRGTCQDTETITPIEAHSLPGDDRQRNLSGHRNNPTDRGPLTNWRRQTEGLVRTPKRSDQARPTHSLETADRATCQDTEESDRPRPTHSLETADRGTCQDTETI